MRRDRSVQRIFLDKVDDAEIWLQIEVYAEDEMQADAIAESYSASVAGLMDLGSKMKQAASLLPDDAHVTDEEMRLVRALESEVDLSFGQDARLYGRAVALYAVRDLAH